MKYAVLLLVLLGLSACNTMGGVGSFNGTIAGCLIGNANMHVTATCTYP